METCFNIISDMGGCSRAQNVLWGCGAKTWINVCVETCLERLSCFQDVLGSSILCYYGCVVTCLPVKCCVCVEKCVCVWSQDRIAVGVWKRAWNEMSVYGDVFREFVLC